MNGIICGFLFIALIAYYYTSSRPRDFVVAAGIATIIALGTIFLQE
jgi:hypothetical protein